MLLRKPKLLILDEPTAALDEFTAKKLVHALKAYCQKYNITLFVITHSNVFNDISTKSINLDNNN